MAARLLSDELVPVKPMTEAEAARGREIRNYPTRYDHFKSRADLVEYLRYMLLTKGRDWNPNWMRAGCEVFMTLVPPPGVYYRPSAPRNTVNCVNLGEHWLGMPAKGGTLVELDPELWPLDVLKEVIAEVQALFQPSGEQANA